MVEVGGAENDQSTVGEEGATNAQLMVGEQ